MGCMDGKTGLVVGIANDRSYAWFIAESIIREGGTCVFTHLPGEKMERRARKAIEALGVADPWLRPMDASSDESMDEAFAAVAEATDTLDFLVHSIAFADRDWLQQGKFTATPREVFTQAMDISAWTYMAMANRALPLMSDGGSMLAMSYYGAEKAVPGYNVMGVAKAALEATTRYLAMELGERNIRVNTISGGPLRTMSSMAVGGFSSILDWVEQKAPLKRNVTGQDVGDSAVWLLSGLSSGVTGQTIYVDCGYSVMGL
ncbi:MAG: enoyl-ACP reductase [Phycisphaerales bacterium]|jgi:enoyl-[acyl-carrier protein] reductase I|nr:enoyl-[acyl-carrier-protein] reductase FabI [Planctomycetaceae bacterium]MDP6157519.1 enoyl-ACP reductase [Phycisphaerales bacterium]MDP7086966.1 enoyl-ACP reductase [Phycisphaerales bacterium]MDP7520110.1 enoyl-ACP reductase [Phycisphaerales bacterium]HJN80593.1 enoyl-ACP reductase [Phycisphaerales bacterium]|tara:strand:+ start:377 stop:1156 length:780 start_codon:yes stop_codon:yes gene_type:complete